MTKKFVDINESVQITSGKSCSTKSIGSQMFVPTCETFGEGRIHWFFSLNFVRIIV